MLQNLLSKIYSFVEVD